MILRASDYVPGTCEVPGTSGALEASAAQAELRQVEAQVDVAAADLWGLTDDELTEIKRSLAELG